jgi:DNA polymerase delta subunit 1
MMRGADTSGSNAKRPRPPGDDDDDDEFMEDMMDEEEDLMDDMMQPPPEEEPIMLLGQADMAKFEQQWRRPPLPSLDPDTDALDFQQVEADYAIMPMAPEFANGSKEPKEAVVRIYGVTAAGNSLTVHVHGFKPYFFVRAPLGFQRSDLPAFHSALATRLKSSVPARDGQGSDCVLHVELVTRQSIMHYSFKQSADFIRVVVALPSMVATARRQLENGLMVARIGSVTFETFESNCAYVLRYMVDRQIVGCNWLTVPASKWRRRLPGGSPKPATTCQLEVDSWFSEIISHECDGEWMGVAPMRILSFDIECQGRPGIFPEAEKDPVIQIANHVMLQGQAQPVVKNIFTLKECAPIAGAQVLSFETEAEMLRSWHLFLLACDADIITGYNIVNFDLPYLLNRAAALKIPTFPYLGRVKGMPTKIKDKMFQSKQTGTRESKEINIEGRVQFDVMAVLMRDYKLSSYSLNAVCAHFLGEQKEDVHHSIISDLQSGNSEPQMALVERRFYLHQIVMHKVES